MSLKIDWVAIDCKDADRLSRFWAQALGYEVRYSSPEGEDDREVLLGPAAGSGPQLLLLEVPDEKTVKNRLHLDLRPDDRDAEVARLEALGATRVDIGQGDVTWIVMADVEGNEFCVLRPPTPEEAAEQSA